MSAEFTLQEIVQATGGRVRQRGAGSHFVGITTDSRTAQAGQIYLPLKGEKFDGHDFIPGALQRGVAALVAAENWTWPQTPPLPSDLTVVLVPDTLQALGDLAHFWRLKFSGPVIAITGSCGKTTTKEMIAQILSRKFAVLKNDLNLNNLIGMPQTLLGLTREHEVAVVECGMNRFGEIRRLSQIARPDIAVVTNVHSAHLEGLGSVAGVARAKSEIIEGLRQDGLLIYNSDDSLLKIALRHFKGRSLGFGVDADARVRAVESCRCGFWGQKFTVTYRDRTWQSELPLPGPHQIYNALAAMAVGLTLGLSPDEISSTLAQFQSPEKRSQLHRLESGLIIYNDCYNANPGSMAMALQTLADLKNHGKSLAALGDMLELGQTTDQAHKELGALAARLNVDLLVLCGNYKHLVKEGALAAGMSAQRIHAVPSHAAAAGIVKEFCRPGDTLLIKGSRGARMEKLLSCLQDS
jgi:UDP-N-acetylmuramoyl-tripeptide--D-alanyl-D-alanine ligase